MIVTVLDVDRGGEPLSVALKVRVKVIPAWDALGAKEKVPVAGLPADVEKLIPETRPDALNVIVFRGMSVSVALTLKVRVESTGIVFGPGTVRVGGVLTSLT